uniref:Uncharacterized protein n=1 Tax=Rhizophora mucronata TaxID=61149 RepID=A0A2P2L438_RHIMU
MQCHQQITTKTVLNDGTFLQGKTHSNAETAVRSNQFNN